MSNLVRKATLADIDLVKVLADKHRTELGFVMRPSLGESVNRNELLISLNESLILTGFVHYRHLKSETSTIYHICVEPSVRGTGLGRLLLDTLAREAHARGKTSIRVKCPQDLAANRFYERCGYRLRAVETGKVRALNLWELRLVL